MERKMTFSQNAAYNTIGSLFYCICQWIITVIVARTSDGYESAGILQLAMSITNLFDVIACFVHRNYQISDIQGEFTPGEYVGIRLLSSFLSLAICAIYAAISGYSLYAWLCICIYMLFKITEAMSDVLRGFAQINYRMDYECASYIIRGILTVSTFKITLQLSDDVFLAILFMAVISFLCVAVVDVRFAKKTTKIRVSLSRGAILTALHKCTPIVLSNVLVIALSTFPRQLLEKKYGIHVLGYYASIATPIVIVQLLAMSIFNPALTDISSYYQKRDATSIRRYVKYGTLLLVVSLPILLIGAFFFGEKAFVLIYGEAIREYCYLMYAVIGSAIACISCNLSMSVLTIFRKQKKGLAFTAIGGGIVGMIGKPLILISNLNGATYVTLIGYLVITCCGFVVIKTELRELERK